MFLCSKRRLSSYSRRNVSFIFGFWLYWIELIDLPSSAIWVLDDLIKAVGLVDRSASFEALSTWVDHGILIEDPEFTFNLLERADLGCFDARERDPSRLGMFFFCLFALEHALTVLPATLMDNPPLLSVQQQQAEQMRVYWKVHSAVFLCWV